MFGFYPPNLASRHGVSNGSPSYYALEAKYHQMAHRHRFDLVRNVDNLNDMNNYHKRYLTGELYTGSMDTIRMQAKWTHDNPGVGKNIPTLVTNKIMPKLQGFVDFWSVSSEEANLNTSPENIASEKALGHKFGIYNGYRPGMGAVVSDADAVEFRVMPWIVWKYNIDQYFHWSTNFWTDLNVFVNPLTFDDRINGDGTFLYPEPDVVFSEENRKKFGPCSFQRQKKRAEGHRD